MPPNDPAMYINTDDSGVFASGHPALWQTHATPQSLFGASSMSASGHSRDQPSQGKQIHPSFDLEAFDASLLDLPPSTCSYQPFEQQMLFPNPNTANYQSSDLQCWEHGCNGRLFSNKSNFKRHCKEQSRRRPAHHCPYCNAYFSRTSARDLHMLKRSCARIRRYSNGRIRPKFLSLQGQESETI